MRSLLTTASASKTPVSRELSCRLCCKWPDNKANRYLHLLPAVLTPTIRLRVPRRKPYRTRIALPLRHRIWWTLPQTSRRHLLRSKPNRPSACQTDRRLATYNASSSASHVADGPSTSHIVILSAG